jgi:organic radical activating enzyme
VYLKDLKRHLNALIESQIEDLEINLTGGEPTLSPYFGRVLDLLKSRKKHFKKIVLTTNGTNLKEHWDSISSVVDHLNISRHSSSKNARVNIFGFDPISDGDIKKIAKQISLKKTGIKDITCVAVAFGKQYENMLFYTNFIRYCKRLGVKCAIRKDYNLPNWDIWAAASIHAEKYKVLRIGRCPVCLQIEQDIEGVNVTWKFSEKNPTDVILDYEYVVQPNGFIYHDWDCRFLASISSRHQREQYIRLQTPPPGSGTFGASCTSGRLRKNCL